jgi:hypothetical protein
MLQRIVFRMVPLLALVGTFGVSMDARSSTNGAGIMFKGYYPADEACLQGSGFGAIYNNCSDAHYVVFAMHVPAGWHPTSVNVWGNNSFCQSASAAPEGAWAMEVGPETWTTAGPKTWKVIDTGERYVWDDTTVSFFCQLEGGGLIGSVIVS